MWIRLTTKTLLSSSTSTSASARRRPPPADTARFRRASERVGRTGCHGRALLGGEIRRIGAGDVDAVAGLVRSRG
jgi:hypothetical protein